MRAIIISDADARALLDQLELIKLRHSGVMSSDPGRPPSVDDIHRAFHYVVTRWLQEQGAETVRR